MTAAPLSAETKDAQTGSPVEVLRAFLKLGLTCFGVPIAHIGYFREEFVVRRKWLDEQAYADLVALCQRRLRPAKNQPPPCPRRLARRTEVVGRRAPAAPFWCALCRGSCRQSQRKGRRMTDLYAVIGNPIGHTKSPLIHKAFAAQTGQDLDYISIEGTIGGFAGDVDAWRAKGLRGLNITAPFKLDAFAYADRLQEEARFAGAVNCLAFDGNYADG
jgi:hypothetical protein